jgi:hypothetical protein
MRLQSKRKIISDIGDSGVDGPAVFAARSRPPYGETACALQKRPLLVNSAAGGAGGQEDVPSVDTCMFFWHNPYLLALSAVIAIVGGYTGLRPACAGRVASAAGCCLPAQPVKPIGRAESKNSDRPKRTEET